MMVKFRKREIAKENFYAEESPINILDVNVDNIVLSKLVKTKSNFKYLVEYVDKTIRPLVLKMPKIRYLKLKKETIN